MWVWGCTVDQNLFRLLRKISHCFGLCKIPLLELVNNNPTLKSEARSLVDGVLQRVEQIHRLQSFI